MTQQAPQRIRTVCGLNDYFRCGLTVEVKDGSITGVRAADFPDPRDRCVCLKGLAAADLAYNPDRLKHPLRRVGARGEGKWQQITWEEAFEGIAAGMQKLQQRYGPSSIVWMTATLPNLNGGGYSRLISLTKGTWMDWWGCGDAAGPCADLATFGTMMGEGYLLRTESPKTIIVWGYNPEVTVSYYMRQIMSARAAGAKVIVIDPRFTETAARADEHVSIRPGTDCALALAMLNVVLDRGLQDEAFLKAKTVAPFLVRKDNGRYLRQGDIGSEQKPDAYVVFDRKSGGPALPDAPGIDPQLSGRCVVSGIECAPVWQFLIEDLKQYTPQAVAGITGIEAGTIERLALAYATEKPAAIYRGWGIQRTFYGDLACRAVNALAAATGNMNLDRPPTFALNAQPFIMPAGPYGSLPVLSLHQAVCEGKPFPVKGVFCAGHNFVNQMPNLNKTVRETLPNLELLVVADMFMTMTAQYAEYVLPVSTFLENTDIHIAMYQNTYLHLQQKIIEPLHESRSDFQIAAGLGRHLGFAGYFSKTEEEYIEELLDSKHPSMEGVSLERLKEGPILAKGQPRPPALRTPTGRVEFYVEALKDFKQELPVYMEPIESENSELTAKFPLTFLTVHPVNRIHSTLALLPRLAKLDPEPLLEMNPADARSRGLQDGEVARVFNDRGEMKVRVKVTEGIRPGVVSVTEGWWPQHLPAGHSNELTHDFLNPAQQAIFQANAAFFDVLVEVEKAPY